MMLRLAIAAALSFSPIVLAQPDNDWATASLPNLQKAADKGFKPAQFELGRRYEEGDGVARDIARARKWYKRAARDSVSRNFVYSGPVGSEQHGRVIEIGRPKVQPGILAASLRLRAISELKER